MSKQCARCPGRAALRRPKTFEQVRLRRRAVTWIIHLFACVHTQQPAVADTTTTAAVPGTCSTSTSSPTNKHTQHRCAGGWWALTAAPSCHRAAVQGVLLSVPRGRGAPHHHQQWALQTRRASGDRCFRRQGLHCAGTLAHLAEQQAQVSE